MMLRIDIRQGLILLLFGGQWKLFCSVGTSEPRVCQAHLCCQIWNCSMEKSWRNPNHHTEEVNKKCIHLYNPRPKWEKWALKSFSVSYKPRFLQASSYNLIPKNFFGVKRTDKFKRIKHWRSLLWDCVWVGKTLNYKWLAMEDA